MAAATTVNPVRTIVIGIASDITVMRTDMIAGDTLKGEPIALGTVARPTTQSKTVSANRTADTEICLRNRGRRSWRPLSFQTGAMSAIGT
jgi:thiamine monophosphate kinase